MLFLFLRLPGRMGMNAESVQHGGSKLESLTHGSLAQNGDWHWSRATVWRTAFKVPSPVSCLLCQHEFLITSQRGKDASDVYDSRGGTGADIHLQWPGGKDTKVGRLLEGKSSSSYKFTWGSLCFRSTHSLRETSFKLPVESKSFLKQFVIYKSEICMP